MNYLQALTELTDLTREAIWHDVLVTQGLTGAEAVKEIESQVWDEYSDL